VCLEGLVSALKPFSESGKEVDLHRAVSMYHMKAIGKAALGHDFGPIDIDRGPNAFHQAFEFMLGELPRRGDTPAVVMLSY